MSDVTGGGPSTPPGWYNDAHGTMRWWDGSVWTDRVRDSSQVPGSQFGPAPAIAAAGPTPWFKKRRWQVGGVVLALFVIGSVTGDGEGGTDPVTVASDTSTGATQGSVSDSESEAGSTPETPKPKPKTTPKPKPKPVAAAAMPVNAGPMLDEFEGNEAAADLKYKGKTLRITGNVDKVDTEFWDEDQYVVMLDDGSEWAFLSVNCNDVSAEAAATIQVGSSVTMVGTFDDGGDLGVELKDCKLA